MSIIFLALWFNFNYETRQLEKKINNIKIMINTSNEKNRVLLLEYAAHISPPYLNKLTSIYLDSENKNNEKIVILKKDDFLKRIFEQNESTPVVLNNSLDSLEINN